MARRFIVKDEDIKLIDEERNIVEIKGEEVKHIQVLRINVGEEITVNSGIYKIKEMTRDSIVLEFVKDAPLQGIPENNITLYIAFLKSDKMDYLVQKAVEIGVKKIVPFFSNNVIVKLDGKDRVKRQTKLQKIADEACKQCGRMDTVEVAEFLSFTEVKQKLAKGNRALFAYEAAKESLRTEINSIKEENITDVDIVIGAEGGFTPKEADELKEIDSVRVVSLGSRILRAETAAINLLSIVIYELEEI